MRRRVASAVVTIRAREAASSARLLAFAIAVATSSVKSARRASVSAGSRSSPVDATTMTPHSRSSTLIGAPTAELMPRARASSAAAPEASA
jgi:hypothetical protein